MRSKRLRRALGNSAILNALDKFSSYIYSAASRSAVGRYLTGYDAGAPGRSLLSLTGERLGLERKVSIPLKRAVGSNFERSLAVGAIKRIVRIISHTSVQVYGIGLFSAGMYTAIMYLVTRFAMGNADADIISLFIGAVCAFMSVPLLFSAQPLGEAVTESRLGSFIFITVFGFRREVIYDGGPAVGKNTVAFVAGMAVGLTAYFISPLYMLVGAIGLIFVYMLLSMPEIGVLLLIGALPFLPTMYIAGLICITAACFFFKYIRGKRIFRFELLDVIVLVYMILNLCGGAFSVDRALSVKPALLYACFTAAYFLVVNLIRTPEWAGRCIVALLLSAFAVSAIGIYENFFGQLSLTWIDSDMFQDIEGRVVSTFANPNVLAEYLILTLPFALAAFLVMRKPAYRFAALAATAASALCLVFTWSRGAWLGMMLALLVFFLIYNRKTVSLLCFGLLAVPFLPLILPPTVISRFTSIGNLSDTSTAYRVHIWIGSLSMARDVFLSGLGSGMGVFSAVYPQYSLGGIEAAPHSHNLYLQILIELGVFGLFVFAAAMVAFIRSALSCHTGAASRDRAPNFIAVAGMCAIIAFLIQGMTDYVFYNYRVFAMFWLALGITSAVTRQLAAHRSADPYTLQ